MKFSSGDGLTRKDVFATKSFFKTGFLCRYLWFFRVHFSKFALNEIRLFLDDTSLKTQTNLPDLSDSHWCYEAQILFVEMI
jgi:hypothetical protein